MAGQLEKSDAGGALRIRLSDSHIFSRRASLHIRHTGESRYRIHTFFVMRGLDPRILFSVHAV
jgi:hypothetical protein